MANKKKAAKQAIEKRVFNYNGIKLEDPDSSMSTDDVKEFYAGSYPELSNAGIKGPVTEKGVAVYTFNIQTGTKG